jgi:pyrimidine oxygenase
MTSAHMEKEVEYGVFMPVGEGGWIRSTTAPPVPATYAYNRQVAILAEQLGLDFLLAMAKWRGFGGASNHWDTTLESMTVITALAEVTTRVRLIPTVHTLAFNVALVAKMLATLDHIAHGRAGLNVVSGWFRDELGQMGLWPEHISHAERYAVAGEWVQALKRLWQEDRVTFHGRYIHLEDCVSNPKPLQKPHPPIICAGNSDTGLRFTVEEAQAAFINAPTHAEAAATSRRAKRIAAQLGKSIKTYAMVMIIPGQTNAEALLRMEDYNAGVNMVALQAGVASHLHELQQAQAHGEAVIPTLQRRIDRATVPDPYIPGYPYVGSAVSIAQQLQEVIIDGDFDGFVLTFPDFIADLQFFGQRVLPLMADAGFARPLQQVRVQ